MGQEHLENSYSQIYKKDLLNAIAEELVELTLASETAGDDFLIYLISMARIEAAKLAAKQNSGELVEFDRSLCAGQTFNRVKILLSGAMTEDVSLTQKTAVKKQNGTKATRNATNKELV